MLDPFTMAMIGASVGALSNPKKPLKGALIGGTMGYAGGSAFGGGAGGGLLGSTTANTAGNAGLGAGAGTAGSSAFEASMGLPNSAFIGSGGSLKTALSGTANSIPGMTAGADGVLRSSDYFTNILGSPIYTGNEGLLSQIGTGANSIFDTAKADLGEYATAQNLIGVSNLLSNMNQAQPMPSMGGGGGMQGGTPPKFEPFVTGQVYTRKRRG